MQIKTWVFRHVLHLFIHCIFSNLRQIFTSEDVELPREAVSDYLEEFDLSLCAKFLEFIITERHEEATRFHDRLAELYLHMVLSSKKDSDGQFFNVVISIWMSYFSPSSLDRWKEVYSKLLAFIASDSKFVVDRFYGLTSGTGRFPHFDVSDWCKGCCRLA